MEHEELIIDEEFRALIPPLTSAERSELEQSILADGCLSPIIVWRDTIVDGHHRYEICQRHSIPFEVSPIEFQNRDEAISWIVHNQLGRRNLNNFTRIELALQLEPQLRALAKENQRKGSQHVGKAIHTDKEVGKLAGVSDETVRRVRFILKLGSPIQIAQAREGRRSISALFRTLSKIPSEARAKDEITMCKDVIRHLEKTLFTLSILEVMETPLDDWIIEGFMANIQLLLNNCFKKLNAMAKQEPPENVCIESERLEICPA